MYLYNGFEIDIDSDGDPGQFTYRITKTVKEVVFTIEEYTTPFTDPEQILLIACNGIDKFEDRLIHSFRVQFANFCAKVEVKPRYYFERGYNVDYFLRMVCMIKHTCGKWITETID